MRLRVAFLLLLSGIALLEILNFKGYQDDGAFSANSGAFHFQAEPLQANTSQQVRSAPSQFPSARQRQHREPLVFFVHAHKAAGTSICRLAKHLKLKTPPQYKFWGNCQMNCSAMGTLYYGEDSSKAGTLLDAFDFVGNEVPLVQLPPLPSGRPIVYVSVIREPCSRAVSHYYHVMSIYKKPFQCKTARCEYNRGKNPHLVDADFETWFTNAADQFSGIGCRSYDWFKIGVLRQENFQVRMMCGERCSSKPFGSIDEEDYRYALQLMDRVGIEAFTLEQLVAPDSKHWLHLRSSMGRRWALAHAAFPAHGGTKNKTKQHAGKVTVCSPKVTAWLHFDYQLHQNLTGRSLRA
eukprot:TRINITY_DN83412_c0_g1_i1.p1 TRINITY_DN83412_c0_g1~~TRINITY_DN83412_c0_g1_i1.p1  ORF type:complete len:351 (+),score=66.95 TRINITY_DN83412_c0_g1_i1:69-1121(+)